MFLKKLKNEENYLEFKNIINDIRLNEKVREMSNYMTRKKWKSKDLPIIASDIKNIKQREL